MATLVLLGTLFSGCQLGYLASSSYYQLRMLSKRESFEKALSDPKIDAETKRKIRLVQEVKKFAEKNLELANSKSYESFVLLNDQYVVYAITASYKDRLDLAEKCSDGIRQRNQRTPDILRQ